MLASTMTDSSTSASDMIAADPYEVLQLHQNAHPLVVMRTFRVLAAMYHPDNKQTGDRVKFEQVVNAYRTLSDPVRRAQYDRTESAPVAAPIDGRGLEPPTRRQSTSSERRLRLLILTTLYNTRRSSLSQPGLSLRVLADMTDSQLDEVQFSLWYLRGKKFIEIGENDEVAITVTGVDFVEDNAEMMDEMLSLPEARGALEAGDRPTDAS
jgi:curved DNA-binding protein